MLTPLESSKIDKGLSFVSAFVLDNNTILKRKNVIQFDWKNTFSKFLKICFWYSIQKNEVFDRSACSCRVNL